MPAELWTALLLWLISFSYLCIFRRFTNMDPDEGILLQGAQRILAGQMLYRDFFSFITPGSYYLLATVFRVFGSSFLVARTQLALAGSLFSVFTYLLSRRVCSRRTAILVSAAMTATCLPFRFLTLHNWDSTLWACGALYCAARLIEAPNYLWSFGTGSLISLTFLFEQSKGAGLMLGIGAGLLTIMYLDRTRTLLKRHEILALAFGLSWSLALTLAYFGLHGAWHAMVSDWFWPLHNYTQANRVPYGYQNWSAQTVHLLFGTGSITKKVVILLALSPCFLLPVLPIGAVVFFLFKLIRHSTPMDGSDKYYLLMSATIGGLLLSVIMARADIEHFIYLEPIFCLPLAWIFEGRNIPGDAFKTWSPLLKAYISVAFLLLSTPLLLRAVQAPASAATRRGVITTASRDTALEYLQEMVKPGESVLVYPYLPIYYYLSATFSPGAYDYLQAGMHTRGQFEEMLSQISSAHLGFVLLEIDFSDKIPNSWPATPLEAMATDPVASFLFQQYHGCASLRSATGSHFVFMVPNGMSCPR
jgi:hypothetical protein